MFACGKLLRRLMTIVSLGLMLPSNSASAQDAEDRAWDDARIAGTAQSFQGYLDRFPTGRYASEAFACIVAEARGLSVLCSAAVQPAAGSASNANATGVANLY